jgi:hypothetical protein
VRMTCCVLHHACACRTCACVACLGVQTYREVVAHRVTCARGVRPAFCRGIKPQEVL